MSGVDPCSNIIPEDYYLESECDKKCMCESRSLEECFECSSACYRSKVGSILDDYPTD